MRKFIVLPLLVLLAACTERTAVGPEGDPGFVAAKGGKGKGGGGGGGGGGGDEPLPPDLAAIVFARGGLVVMNADGSNETLVYDWSGVATPSWSWDGTGIVFHQTTDQGDWIRRIELTVNGGDVQMMGEVSDLFQCVDYFGTPRANCHPAWSPAADEIAVADGMSKPAQIHIISADLGISVDVYTAPATPSPSEWDPNHVSYNAVRWPTWNSAGDKLAFVEDGLADEECTGSSGGVCIRVIERQDDTTWGTPGTTCKLESFSFAESLEWGRTDDLIVFSGLVLGERKGGVYTLDINKNCMVAGPIISGGKNPVWSADDLWIAWVKTRGDKLMLYSDATGNSYNVASNVRDPDWLREQTN